MLFNFEGRVAVVTGGASGIGRTVAEDFAKAGASVILLDRDKTAAAQVLEQQAELGHKAHFEEIDLRDPDAITPVVNRVLERFGRIDFLVNGAGILRSEGLLEITPETWDLVMDVNLRAAVFLTQRVARHMMEPGEGGRIVNIASGQAVRAGNPVAYCCSKAGLAHLTRVSARALGPHGINVNTVAPGLTETPMLEENLDFYREQIANGGALGNMLGRFSETRDVSGPVLFLCAPESRHITAQVLHTSAGSVY